MPSKRTRYLFISFVSFIILGNVISSSMIFSSQESWRNSSQFNNNEDNSKPNHLALDIKLQRAVSQENTTTTDTTTTEGTNTTETADYPPWKPFLVDENLYYPLALIFSVLGILSTLWLIFFVETSKDRTIRERIIGSAIRLGIMSLTLGLALHFWILFEPI